MPCSGNSYRDKARYGRKHLCPLDPAARLKRHNLARMKRPFISRSPGLLGSEWLTTSGSPDIQSARKVRCISISVEE